MDAKKRPPFHDGHAAPLIQILAWLFLAFSTLSIIAHFATKTAMSRSLTRADFILFAALILAGGQAVTLLCPAGQAIGNSQIGLTEQTVMQAWKALYSGEILSILTLVAAKSSLLVPFMVLTPVVEHRTMMYTTCIITLMWGLSGVLLIGFQCPSPQRWNISNPQCMDIRAIRTYNAVMNIATDLALTTVPTLMIMPLQIRPEKRVHLLIAFWCRIIVVIASCVQISYIRSLPPFPDLLNSIWRVVVCGQVVQVTSIMTSTIPFLKPFLLSLESTLTLNTNAATRITTWNHPSAVIVGCQLSYVQISAQQSATPGVNKRSDIWVKTDAGEKEEAGIDLPELRKI